MFTLIKLLLMTTYLSILYQDVRERLVYWFLFPIAGLCSGVLMYHQMEKEVFFATVLFNITITTIYLLVIFLYTKHVKKIKWNQIIGIGDVLFFYALCFAFAMVSFYVLFLFSFLFALILHLLTKKTFKNKTVPLAGFMSLFFGLVYISYWAGIINSIYSI